MPDQIRCKPLFDTSPKTARIDAESEQLIQQFRSVRLSAGAQVNSVAREASQLRSVVRSACRRFGSITLADLCADPHRLSDALSFPPTEIARSTARARVVAVQRFLAVIGLRLELNHQAILRQVVDLLPISPGAGWHRTGVLQVGAQTRRRVRGPTLSPTDLADIVSAAASVPDSRGIRDRALVALHCFSGLRPHEIAALAWEDVTNAVSAPQRVDLRIKVARAGGVSAIPLSPAAAEPLRAWASYCRKHGSKLLGPVFNSPRNAGAALSERASREIVRAACFRAGFPAVESVSLRSACAYWLSSQQLQPHQIAQIMGIARVQTIDRLLKRHMALDAQRTATSLLDR